MASAMRGYTDLFLERLIISLMGFGSGDGSSEMSEEKMPRK